MLQKMVGANIPVIGFQILNWVV